MNGWLIAAIVVLTVLMLLVAEMCIEKKILRVRRQEIPLAILPQAFDGLKIVQLSDLHHGTFGEGQCRILEAVRRCQPDVILLTGDMISRDQRDFSEIQTLAKGLCETAPVYFAMGNHEIDLPQQVQEQYLHTLHQAGVQVLWNETVHFSRAGQSIALTGATLSYGVYRDEHRRFRHLDPYSVEKLTADLGKHSHRPTILLAHNPLLAPVYQGWGAELVLSGHVHGGIVRMPVIGGLLSPERRFLPAYAKGLYDLGDTLMFVSGGLGKLRLWNPPEINLLTLRTKK